MYACDEDMNTVAIHLFQSFFFSDVSKMPTELYSPAFKCFLKMCGQLV